MIQDLAVDKRSVALSHIEQLTREHAYGNYINLKTSMHLICVFYLKTRSDFAAVLESKTPVQVDLCFFLPGDL